MNEQITVKDTGQTLQSIQEVYSVQNTYVTRHQKQEPNYPTIDEIEYFVVNAALRVWLLVKGFQVK